MGHVTCNTPSKIVCGQEGCGAVLAPRDLRELLSPGDFEKYEASTMTELLSSNRDKFVECPKCQNILERIVHLVNNGANGLGVNAKSPPRDPVPTNSPVPLTPETIDHHSNYRFRCRNCETEFCSECSTIPYHLGFTCQTFKNYKSAAHCRFCSVQLTKANTAPPMQYSLALHDVCTTKDCLQRRDTSCASFHKCGHACGGIIQDSIYEHLPCWKCPPPPGKSPQAQSSQTEDDYCPICWSESLGSAPTIRLACSHIFHFHCLIQSIQAKWAGVAITFAFLECPLCKQQISHPALTSHLKPFLELQADVKKKALDRFEHMKVKDAPELTDPNSAYFKQPLKYAMARFCYYQCFKCNKPYFGGLKECNAEQRVASKDDKRDELICGSCAAQGSGANQTCSKHGTDFIEFKCKFCCNVAAWYCWGTTHFCEDCHKKAAEIAKVPRDKLPKCTCGGKHPPNGEEFCLGCSFCRFNDKF